MYHPYFRGKQFELIAVRESAELLASAGFVPIIEPVKEALGGLERTLKAVSDANGSAVIVTNPLHGDHSFDGVSISEFLRSAYSESEAISAGILLRESMSVSDVIACCERHDGHALTLIHAGFTKAKQLAEELGSTVPNTRNVFFEAYCGKLYRKHFAGSERILIRDGFEKRKNREYPLIEPFSDLHVTYEEEGMDGFGDFLTVGNEFSESGGPAYAVAIHLTFIDPTQDDAMYVYHFVSDRQDTPTDPAGKFGEALEKLMTKLRSRNCHIYESSAIKEFRLLYHKGHFPGLGYVKKLSMKHHIETLANFLT